jgi:hypothetical protein
MKSVNDPKGAQFEIRVDGLVRTHRDVRDSAIEAARFLKQRNPNAKVTITDLRDGSAVARIGWGLSFWGITASCAGCALSGRRRHRRRGRAAKTQKPCRTSPARLPGGTSSTTPVVAEASQRVPSIEAF